MSGIKEIAVIGNPNTGKTTVFNGLTGSTQRIGNWPGVTVEKKEGFLKILSGEIKIVDLPGIYSLSAQSEDEKIALDYYLSGQADLTLNIIDAANFERNMYLTMQLIEMKVPLILVVNMTDLAKKKGIELNLKHLEKHLGIPVIGISAIRDQDLVQLKKRLIEIEKSKVETVSDIRINYHDEIEKLINKVVDKHGGSAEKRKVAPRWFAVRAVEKDRYIMKIIEGDNKNPDEFNEDIDKVEKMLDDSMDALIAEGRYGVIHGLLKDILKRKNRRAEITDKIDSFILNRWLGIPLFLLMMYLMFLFTIHIGGAFIDFFDILFGAVFVDGFGLVLSSAGAPEWLIALLAGGVGAGIQTIATFVPIIFAMFLVLSLLEDSGYMARAAFVMDRFMRLIGLPGKSFVPMLVGFGCTVPAVMATRTLDEKKDRMLTVFMTPFMSCGARLPVYAIFAAAFFPESAGLMTFSLYFAGILVAVFTGLLLKNTMFKGEPSHFIMELPPYHLPRFSHIMHHTWLRLKLFMIRAGKAIVIIVTLLAFLNSLGIDGSFGNEDSSNSVLSVIGKGITPIFMPMGVEEDNWPASVSLFTGIFAKEAIVGTLNSLYSQNESIKQESEEVSENGFDFWSPMGEAFSSIPANLSGIGGTLGDPLGVAVAGEAGDEEAMSDEFETDREIFSRMRASFSEGKWQAYAYLLFVLLYFPCVAAFAAVLREIGIKLGWFLAFYSTTIAWSTAVLFYQITLGHSVFWILIALAVYGINALGFYQAGKGIRYD